jgi:hypothetical protein
MPMGESSPGMSEILSQLTSVSDENQKAMTRSTTPYFMNTWPLVLRAPLKQVTLPWCEVCRNRDRLGECYYMKKYVQTPTNLYCMFHKSMGHNDRDCMAYDLVHERSRDIYKIQGKVQQEGNTTLYNSPGRGNFNPCSGFIGGGGGGGMGQGQG